MILPKSRTDFPKAIYLDQNIWSALASVYFDKGGVNREDPIMNAIIGSIVKRTAIYPISFIHVEELQKLRNTAHKKEIAKLMVGLSLGLAILNNIIMIKFEIVNAIREIIRSRLFTTSCNGLDALDIRSNLVLPGIVHAYGFWKLEGVPEELTGQFYDALISPETSLWALTDAFQDMRAGTQVNGMEEAANEIERLARLALKDGVRRYDLIRDEARGFFSLDSTKQTINDELRRINIPPNIFFSLFKNESDYIRFFKRIDSYYSRVLLYIEHHKNVGGKTDTHDLNDVQFLSDVLPYFNAVVMEKHWGVIAKQARLDKKYGTEVLTCKEEIPGLLKRMGCV